MARSERRTNAGIALADVTARIRDYAGKLDSDPASRLVARNCVRIAERVEDENAAREIAARDRRLSGRGAAP